MKRDVAANIYLTNVVIVIFLLMFCYALEMLLKLIFFKTSFTLYFNQKFEFTFFLFVSLIHKRVILRDNKHMAPCMTKLKIFISAIIITCFILGLGVLL